MDAVSIQQGEREVYKEQTNRDELAERIARTVRKDGRLEPLKGLHLSRISSPTEPVHGVYDLAFCVVAQGSKVVSLGDNRYRYDPAHYLLVTVELPVVSQVTEASPEQPYLGFRLDIDPILVGSVMVETGHVPEQSQADARAISVSPLDARLLDAVVRLVRLLDTPAEIPFLAPMVTREIDPRA